MSEVRGSSQSSASQSNASQSGVSNPDAGDVRRDRVLVTGGGGFLGRAILRELQRPEAGGPEIRLFDLGFPESEAYPNVERVRGDICDLDALRQACEGVDVVIHAASLVDWGHATPERLEEVNIRGTENVLRVAREVGVRAVVYTSTMDVVCGSEPIVNGDESLAFPSEFTNDYARTKAFAENVVLAADAPDLRTCAIRPCGMYGEFDPYHVENVLLIVKEGNLPFRPGDGSARFQHVYVGNVAYAHVLAMRNLLGEEPVSAGQAYFVTDDSVAINFLDFMEPILGALGYKLPPQSRSIPYPVMLGLAASMEAISFLCRPFFKYSPTLTRSSVRFICHDHTFNGEKLRRELGYSPRYSEAESIKRTIEYFRAREDRSAAASA